ncbi:MAG: hypothetical protein IIB28_09270 [Chloroflexi bacterium]|nr:hypothetical protein [Chloroflexota bacterium]
MSTNLSLLAAALDRVVPAVATLPGAGAMGLADVIVKSARQDRRFKAALETVAAALPDGFASLDARAQDDALRNIESAQAEAFGLFLDITYSFYYMRPDVHERLGWHGRTPQPDGNELPPFDDSVLEVARQRAPLWRKV